MHLILTGATGLVGSAVLDAMIKTKDITKISIISRRPVKMVEDAKDHRINVILHKDFEKYDSEGATTTPLSSQSLLSRLTTPWYAIIKGQAELALSQLSSTPSPSSPASSNPFVVYSMRPGYVDPASHASIHAYIPQLSATMNLLACVLGPAIRTGYKKLWSPTEELGKFCIEMAMGRWDNTIARETEGMKVGDSGRNGFEKLEGGGVVIGNGTWSRVARLG
ncbi:hypothetical protein SMACR_05622 [Sordaria macrospora]|uniref:WGS project CABT00000000 data, contig 2.30 n=2 Tax=Sordaria macrospora TaxID=5147 RepID=F7W573_SORMK|nr:uncharacterized protein SMAC_05622 [Sordaria macrospora k-hell]KAA8630539.1 hypothetical protein SMACR_05622 [Sordaria macrospora]WPJ62506.1 hypothetical protein SMAC4_05622 [Sordaria macrospora]CCC12661.1 unnamed protein product [Sordaria macrospora k-hell]